MLLHIIFKDHAPLAVRVYKTHLKQEIREKVIPNVGKILINFYTRNVRCGEEWKRRILHSVLHFNYLPLLSYLGASAL